MRKLLVQKRTARASLALMSAALFLTAACTSTGNMERGVLQGGAIGAAAGAIIGNNVGDGDAGNGAQIGAAVGAIAGAARGRNQDIRSGEGTRLRRGPEGRDLYFDQQYNRYYYFDEVRGRTYWQNGELRG